MEKETEKKSRVEEWVERVTRLQPDIRMPAGLLVLASVCFLFYSVSMWILPKVEGSAEVLIYLIPCVLTMTVVCMVFFATLIPLLHQSPIYHAVLIGLYLIACVLPFLLNDMPDSELIFFIPLIVALSIIISTSPLILLRIATGLRITSQDAAKIARRPFSITRIFGLMIGTGIVFAVIVALVNYQSDQSSHASEIPFIESSLYGMSIFFFISVLLHLPIFLVGFKLKFPVGIFWLLVVAYWLVPVFLVTSIAFFFGGEVTAGILGWTAFNFALNAFGYASLVMIVRNSGYRLMLVPVTVRTYVDDPEEDFDPLQ